MKRNVDVTISQLAKSGLNQPEKVENFKDLAFGMFVHWSADCTIGSVISHWMIGCEEKLIDEFVERRARWFDPRYFAQRSCRFGKTMRYEISLFYGQASQWFLHV